jgi:hypothetical protein
MRFLVVEAAHYTPKRMDTVWRHSIVQTHRAKQGVFGAKKKMAQANRLLTRLRTLRKKQKFKVVENFMEKVNPVYRRRRLAKVLKAARTYFKAQRGWEKTSDRLDKKSDELNRQHARAYGKRTKTGYTAPDYSKLHPSTRKLLNAQHDRLNQKRGFAQDQVFHYQRKGSKAYNLGTYGRRDPWDSPKGQIARPPNPLAKNRKRQRRVYGRSSITGDWREKPKDD